MQVQLHDFSPGIAPNGLFWTTRIADDDLEIKGKTARYKVRDLRVVDNLTFLGPDEFPAKVSFEIVFKAFGPTTRFEPGSDDPLDPSNFAGKFRQSNARATFSGRSGDFRFRGTGTTDGMFAEMGDEKNGVFLRSHKHGHNDKDDDDLNASLFDTEDAASTGEISLARAVPNPALSGTSLQFTLTQASEVTVEIFDLAGRRVARLLDHQPFGAGRQEIAWNLREEGRRIPGGVYLVLWKTASESRTMRLAVLP